MMSTVVPADLLFWADEVRKLAEVPPEQVRPCVDVIATWMEWTAQQMLAADIRGDVTS